MSLSCFRSTPKITAHKCVSDLNMFISPSSSCVGLPADGVLNWLVFSASTLTPSSLKVVWNLREFAGAVLHLLPGEISETLSRPPHRVKFGNYRLFYIADKLFGVNKNGSESVYYDLSQYFPGEREPGTINGLQEKADLLYETLSGLGIVDPPSLSSPLACFRGHDLLKPLDGAFPSIFDLEDEWLDAQELALQCTPREWISNYKIGHFPSLWKADISSAYPQAASFLPDLRECSICESTGVNLLANFGVLVGDFTVYPDHPYAFCSPFLADRGDGVLVNFTGTAKDYVCTIDDVRVLSQYKMGEFRFKRGWLVYWREPPRPFHNVMHQLFDLRGASPLRSHLLKRVMNGIVGQLLETRRGDRGCVVEYGEHYNPIYHAMITNSVRLRVFDQLVQQGITEDELVHVGVDGFRTIRQLSLPDSAPMGEWRCAGEESAFVLSPGAIISSDRRFKWTDYSDLLSECKSRPASYLLGKNSDDPINVRHLFLRQTRSFPKMPKNAGDLLGVFGSEPLTLPSTKVRGFSGYALRNRIRYLLKGLPGPANILGCIVVSIM